jgi:hypothetical protein
MELTIDIPEKVIAHAASVGKPVSQLVSQAIDNIVAGPLPPGFARLGTSTKSRIDAAADIRDIAATHTLDGIKIRDLIEEGRRY